MLDLVDIFGPSSEAPPPPSDPWNSTQPTCDVTSDPWDSVGGWLITKTQNTNMTLDLPNAFHLSLFTAVHSSTPVIGSPWTAPPSSANASNPWAPCANSCPDPWEAAPVSSSPVDHAWDSPTDRGIFRKRWCHQFVCTVFNGQSF